MAGALPPSDIPSNAIATIVGSAVENVQFKPSANVLPRKILIVGTYDPTITTIADNKPVLALSAAQVAAETGAGFMLSRLADKCFQGSRGVETWYAPQSEDGGSVQATGEITIGGITAQESGTLHIYIAGSYVPVGVTKGDTVANIAADVIDAINADDSLPITAVVDGVVPAQINITVKSKGVYGNGIRFAVNLSFGQELPYPITVTGTQPTGGAGVSDIGSVLSTLGQGDEQNLDHFTDVIHGYHADSTTYDKLSAYNGEGNDFVGNYSKTVARPFRSLDGDVTGGSEGLAALIVLADSRKLDRTNGVIACPGSPNNPSEIAALAMGIMANVNNNRAEETYTDKLLSGIFSGATGNRWSSQYSNRNLAVMAGISPTLFADGVLKMQDVCTFYHPDAVPIDSNGYKLQRNISILQNVLYNNKLNFSQEKWKRITIVQDVTKVSNLVDREKARDKSSVMDDLLALADAYEGNAWLYTAEFTKSQLQAGDKISLRPGLTGFNISFPIILSGAGGIIDMVTKFDTSIAVLL